MNSSLIILAAGRSSRMGTPKALLSIGDQTLIEYQVEKAFLLGVSHISLVVGESRDLFELLPICSHPRLTIVQNPDVDQGPFLSVVLGCQSIITESVLILPVDVPLAPAKEIAALYNSSADVVIVQNSITKRGGHPLLLKRTAISLIAAQKDCGSKRLDHFLKGSGLNTERVSLVHPYLFYNLNTKKDYKEFLRLERRE